MILVIGATGKVGSDLVRQLVQDAQPVRALVRDPAKAVKTLPGEAELSRGDLADATSITEALKGADRLFLLGPVDPRLVELEERAIVAAVTAGVKHLVKLSAIGADASSGSMFAAWHGQSEDHIRRSDVPFTFLRPNFFMQ